MDTTSERWDGSDYQGIIAGKESEAESKADTENRLKVINKRLSKLLQRQNMQDYGIRFACFGTILNSLLLSAVLIFK